MSTPIRRRAAAVSVVVAALVVVAGCSSSGSSNSSSSSGSGGRSASKSKLSVAYMVPGTLGDLGFYDSGAAGVKQIAKKFGAITKTVQGGVNAQTTWQNDLQALSNGKYQIVLTGGSVTDQITAVAKANPNQKYVLFDNSVPLPNVASITYRQNDGAFLAGVLAALASTDKADFPLSSSSKNVGVIGVADKPVINDFFVGFKKGVQVVDPSITVQTSYVGSTTDAQTAYNQATAMYAHGADVVFSVAGPAGLGILKASNAKGKYSIGVDSNQNNLYPKNVLASDLKNVGPTVLDIVSRYAAGTLQFGKTYVYGLQNAGVTLAVNNDLVPASVRSKITSFSDQVSSGKIEVPCVQPYCTPATAS